MDAALASPTELLDSPVRRRIVDTLANLPEPAGSGVSHIEGRPTSADGMTAQALAKLLDLHVTTVRFHLDQLVANGLVAARFQRRKSAGRPRKIYSIERGSLESVPNETSYRMLSQLLVESFRLDENGQPLTPEEAGARWGRENAHTELALSGEQSPAETPGQWLGKIGQAVDLLSEWGYSPEVATTGGGRGANISLYECPFISLAHDNTAVVCGIHRGLIRGVMEALGEDEVTVGLQPFVSPTTCLATVATTHPFRPRSGAPTDRSQQSSVDKENPHE